MSKVMKEEPWSGPGLTERGRWPNYFFGMLAEVAFIFGLTALALLMAVVARAVF